MMFSESHKEAQALLDKFEVYTIPIKIEEIAKKEGLKVIPYPFNEGISGTLLINENVIGFNQTESRVRRRFTIAHELGHFMLHRNQNKTVFLDKLFRFNVPNDNQNEQFEMEANAFAAAILMPEKILRKEIKGIEIDLGDELAIKYLAKKFDVSTTAMYFRLLNLKLISPH